MMRTILYLVLFTDLFFKSFSTRLAHEDSILRLSGDEYKLIYQISTNMTGNPSENPQNFCEQARKLSFLLPSRIKSILNSFSRYGSDTGYLLIRADNTGILGLVPKTPYRNSLMVGEKTILARIQSLFVSWIGEMIAYEAEGYGRLYQDVIPMKSLEREQTSVGSGKELEIHTEQAFSKLKPDFLSLACLRGDTNAVTYILPVQYVLDNLDSDEIELLRQPLWKTGVDLSFKLNGNEFIEGDVRGPFPIISGNESDSFFVFDQDLMIGVTQEANYMIKRIVNIYYQHRLSHTMIPGDIIIIDNNRAVHGR